MKFLDLYPRSMEQLVYQATMANMLKFVTMARSLTYCILLAVTTVYKVLRHGYVEMFNEKG